jgi:hypothetical protein
MATAREMANWIFMWDDALSDGTTIINTAEAGHSTEVAGFTAEALLDADRQTCLQISDSGTVYVSFDLGSAQTIKAVGILNHNANISTVSLWNIYRSSNGTSWTLANGSGVNVSTAIGDEDFFWVINGGTGVSYQYWKCEFTGADAGLYVGRFYFARELYELPAGAAVGATKGYLKNESIQITRGGIEHRNSCGLKRRVISGTIPAQVASDTIRTNLLALVDYCDVNDKCFIMSSPYGTTTYTTTSRYGAAIHARLNVEEWRYALQIAGLTDIPLEIVEVL